MVTAPVASAQGFCSLVAVMLTTVPEDKMGNKTGRVDTRTPCVPRCPSGVDICAEAEADPVPSPVADL